MPGKLLKRTWTYDPTLDAPARYKRACHYSAFLPDEVRDLDFSLSADLAGTISEAEHAIRELNHQAGPTLAPMARLLLRTESIASSKVEGMQVGVEELARAEARMETGGRVSAISIEVLSNVDAMMLAVDEAAAVHRFGVDEILAIHKRLIERAENRHIAGRIRRSQNWIGGNDYNPCGADFVPPPPEEVKRLLADLCRAVNDDALPPLAQAALIHAQFETIHPFDDGNGRTGRALIHVVLRRRGVAPQYLPPISVVFANAKSRYIAALDSFRGSGVGDWLAYFASATTSASRLAEAYVKAVADLRDQWRQRLANSTRAPRSDAAAWQIIDVLPAHPVVTAAAAAAASGRSRPQTYQGIEQLVDAGVLQPISESSRNRAWEATGLLKLIAALEAGRLPGR